MESQVFSHVAQERIELEAMVERLARSPRLSNLLRFVGEKYLSGKSDEIREYSIATEVFGRPESFDPGQDAIARVEAHRLRRKLKEYYELEGKDHKVHISIPTGSYVPVFRHTESRVEVRPIDDIGPVPQAAFAEAVVPVIAGAPPQRRLTWLVGAIVLLLLVVVALVFRRSWQSSTGAESRAVSKSETGLSNSPGGGAGVAQAGAVRLLAGYSGQPHIDASGFVWGPDRYFTGGRPWRGAASGVARANDAVLFRSMRTGEFSYDIPLRPGTYELHLYFIENNYGPDLGGGENDRSISIGVNSEVLVGSFDIESDAMGTNIADERVFKNIRPAKDGKLHLTFESVRGEPLICAIEVVPGIADHQLPIRLVTQPMPFIDHTGQMWTSDNYYQGGQESVRRASVRGSSDPELYSKERFGHFTYAIPVDLRGRYTLSLHFAEFYFGPEAPGGGGVGSRRFNVMCNGVLLLEDFDIFKEAGSYRALTKTFRDLKPSPQGKLNLTFEPISNYASISAIEVLDETR